EIVEHVAEVGLGLGLGRVGPEEERQTLPRLGRLPMEKEVGEERGGPRRLHRRQGCLAAAQVELAKEPDAERRSVHGDALAASDLRPVVLLADVRRGAGATY